MEVLLIPFLRVTLPRVAAALVAAALVVSAILIVYLGVLPTRVLDWAAASISTIF